MPQTIGFAGLGAMGGGVAAHLVRQGYTVQGFDISSTNLSKFTSTTSSNSGAAKAAETPRAAATGAEVMISMVADAAQTRQLLFSGNDAALAGLGQGATLIVLSTIAPEDVLDLRRELDEERGRKDVVLLDCPVSGGTVRAAEGQLSIFAAGPAAAVQAVEGVLGCMAREVYRMGALGNGSRAKTVHQLLAATNIIAASEAMGVAANVGLNTPAVFEKVKGSEASSFMFENRVPHMLANDWHPYSALAIILKDAGIVTATARRAQCGTPLVATAEQLYLRGAQAGLLRDDDAKLVQLYLPKAQGDLVAAMAKADVMMTASHQVSKDTVVDLLAGIHLAASVEAMAFCQALGMDRKVMYDIIANAAGWCGMFVKCIPGMLEKDRWTLADCPQAEEIAQRLSDAVDKCRKIKYACPMAAAALQQFHFAALVDKTVENQDRRGR